MRIKIQCELGKDVMPISYNRKILSCFKKSLELYDTEIKNFYYNTAELKHMSFACFFPLQKIENENMYLKSRIFTINITFESIIDGIHFYNAFNNALKKKIIFKMGEENSFVIKSIVKIKEKEIKEDVAIFRILSPVVIREQRENENSWYHILNKVGIDELKKNLEYSLKEKFPVEKIENLEIIPINVNKTVVSFYDIKFPVTKGTFMLKGDKELLNYFYKAGIGSRKASGFGMLEVVESV